MLSGNTDEIVIKKKRRRKAVDPCLGYYSRNVGDAEPADLQEENINQEVQGSTRENVQQKTVSSDSAQTITSPFSEEAAIVTVDDFLRQQAMANTQRHRPTYSRKRQRRIQFSSDDEAENHVVDNYAPRNSNTPSQRPHPSTTDKTTRNKVRKLHHASRKPRMEVGMAFSKRIQRAAVLSCVEQDGDSLAIAPFPLRLAPQDSQISPRSPVYDRRIKLVDPRVPRQLDISFANKDNILHKTKSCRPFLHWGSSLPPLSKASPSVPSTILTPKSSVHKTPRSAMIAPLKLVPYEEHDEARSAKFDRKLSKKGRRVITPLVLQLNCTVSVPSTFHDEDDPFMTLLPTDEPRYRAPSQIEYPSMQHDENVNIEADLSSSPSDFPDILVPCSPLEAPQSPLLAISDSPTEPNINNALQDLQVIYASGSPDIPAPNLKGISPPSHSYPPPSMSQKSMRGLGSMLDSFMETARSVLLSQTRLPSDEDNSSEVLRNRGSRLSSRRVTVSSPTRHTASKRPRNRAATSVMQTTSQGLKKIKKSISMPSVSACLGHDDNGEPETKELPLLTLLPSARRSSSHVRLEAHSSVFHTEEMPRMGVDCESAFNIAPRRSFLFDRNNGCGSPNVFDLLDDAEPRSNAQIILSQTVSQRNIDSCYCIA